MKLRVLAKVTAKTLIKDGDPKTYKGRAREYITTELPSYEGEEYVRHIFEKSFELELDQSEYYAMGFSALIDCVTEKLRQYIDLELWEVKVVIDKIFYTSW